MTSLSDTYESLKSTISKTYHKVVPPKPDVDYMYPCDSYVSTLLNSFTIRKTLQTVAEKYYSDEVDSICAHSEQVTSSNYPFLYSIYTECADCLKWHSLQPPLYVTNHLSGINALSVETHDNQLILISRQAIAQLSDEELRFVLGHELGHCQYGHMCCHTVLGLIKDMNGASELFGPIVTDAFEVPLVKWFHSSEFTADRAGLLCCKSIEVAKNIFVRLGLDKEISIYEKYQELSSPHPLLQTRWEHLQAYAEEINF